MNITLLSSCIVSAVQKPTTTAMAYSTYEADNQLRMKPASTCMHDMHAWASKTYPRPRQIILHIAKAVITCPVKFGGLGLALHRDAWIRHALPGGNGVLLKYKLAWGDRTLLGFPARVESSDRLPI